MKNIEESDGQYERKREKEKNRRENYGKNIMAEMLYEQKEEVKKIITGREKHEQ